ncbi:MAG: hypothetical protein NW200_12025 [Hyphomonadaceae bacterium]|nr:hypothetical protein [Hyphomonadaceae bacterium]
MTDTHPAPVGPPRWRLFAALFGLVLAPAVTVTVSPLLNSVAMDVRGLEPVEIGSIRTAEILLNATLTLWLSTQLTKIAPRTLGLIGAALFCAGNAAGIPGAGLWDLAAARLAAGAGAACLGAAGASVYAQFASPQRASGVLVIPWTMASVTAALIAGESAKAQSQTGVFGVLAAAAVIAAAFIALMPGGRAPAHVSGPHLPIAQSLRSPYVLGYGCLFFGSTAVWHFFARIGLSHGLAADQISQIIAAASVLAGLMGAGAMLVRDRWVRVGMLVSLAAFGAMATTVAWSPSALIYLAAYGLQSVMYVFLTILVPTMGVRIDRTGATNTAAGGVATMINAVAPAIAGALVQGGSFAALGVMCAASAGLSFVLLAYATRHAAAPRAEKPGVT